ncbi:hypothetical protein F5Y17DRAFT_419180 [Xylariaceae sp. FL0594]|nr:hypothetical protein F5Y17DRAFT_419180 [Xylariaceae sp. FL0594]
MDKLPTYKEQVNRIIGKMYRHDSIAYPDVWFPFWAQEDSATAERSTDETLVGSPGGTSVESSAESPVDEAAPSNDVGDTTCRASEKKRRFLLAKPSFTCFMELPTELRLKIWTLAALGSFGPLDHDVVQTVAIHANRSRLKGHFAVHTQDLWNSAETVSRTCREARYEVKRLTVCLPTSFLYEVGASVASNAGRGVTTAYYFDMGRRHYHRDTKFFFEERDALETFYHLSIHKLAVDQLNWLRHLILDCNTFLEITKHSGDLFPHCGNGAPFTLLPSLRTLTVAFLHRDRHDVAMLGGPYHRMVEQLQISPEEENGEEINYHISYRMRRFDDSLIEMVHRTVTETREHVAALEQRGVKVIWGAINHGIKRRSCHPPLEEWPDNLPTVPRAPEPDAHHWISDRHRYVKMGPINPLIYPWTY